jgi:uncharacterized protein
MAQEADVDIEKKLDELGLLDGINEVIVTTNRDGTPNAAPIGLIRDGRSLKVRLFVGTHTYESIIKDKNFVANVVHDPMLFVEAALSELPEDSFQEREGLLTLKDAEAWALFKCSDAFPLDIVIAEVEFVKGEVLRRDYRAFNRGVNLVVEAAIAATRYLALNADSYFEEIIKLERIVKRCGGPKEREAMQRLMDLIDKHKPF